MVLATEASIIDDMGSFNLVYQTGLGARAVDVQATRQRTRLIAIRVRRACESKVSRAGGTKRRVASRGYLLSQV